MPGDALVHHGLRERRIVHLVVAVLAIAHDVDAHVALEPHAVFERQRHGVHAGLRVVTVHVQHGRVRYAHDRRGVAGHARVPRRRREAHLVVDQYVQRAPRLVSRQLRQRQRLGHDALARERGVAVDQHRDAALAEPIRHHLLARAHGAQHDGIHVF